MAKQNPCQLKCSALQLTGILLNNFEFLLITFTVPFHLNAYKDNILAIIMSTIQAIVHATTTLSQIQGADREALLLTHRKELESAFHNLQALLQPVIPSVTLPTTSRDVPTTSTTCASPDASEIPQETSGPQDSLSASAPAVCAVSDASQIALATDTRKTDDNNFLPDRVKALMERLKKREHEILKYSYQPAQSAVFHETDWVFEDPRIVDISFSDESTKSPDTKFRSGLSALSLGDEYTEWESFFGTTRVDTLFGNQNSASGRKGAAYKEYVDSSDRFKDKGKAQKYIEYGVKFRVFERIYLTRVEVSTHAGISAGSHLGVLGILFFVFNEFRRLKYDYLPMLANAILASQWRDHAETLHQSVSLCFESHKGEFFSQLLQTMLSLRNRSDFGDFPDLPASKTRSGA